MIRKPALVFLTQASIAWVVSSTFEAAFAEPPEGSFNVLIENDVFYGLDRNYTNGFLLSWTSDVDEDSNWSSKVVDRIPLFQSEGEVRRSFALGQNIYTPSDITIETPLLTDRPYAGWLYGSIGLISQSEHRLDQLQLQVGIVGPSSLAEDTQTLVHDFIGADEPMGWDHQLRDEPGMVLTYQRSWRALSSDNSFGFGYDVSPHAGGAVGNVLTYANAGATFRMGWNLPNDFGATRIQPSLPGAGYFDTQYRPSVYMFAGVEGRAVARNIFLDGNTWRDSRSVQREPFVGDAEIGLAFSVGSARIAYTHVFRSREFRNSSDADEFGAISLSFHY